MKKILKPFQIEGANFLSKNYHALLADEMGLGKTVTALAAVSSLSLNKVLVVCPASVRSNWKQEIEECGLTRSRFNIVSYNRAVNGLPGSWDLLILDECFPAGTPVETASGPKRIEDVRCGEFVLSCGLSRSVLEYKRVVRTIHKRRRHLMVQIAHEDGSLVCTSNHKVWVEGRGYVQAGEINDGESVRVLRNDVHDAAQGEGDGEVLQSELRVSANKLAAGDKSGGEREVHQATTHQILCELWAAIHREKSGFFKSATKILRQKVCSHIQKLNSRNEAALQSADVQTPAPHVGEEAPHGIRQDEDAQPNVQPHLEGEGPSEVSGTHLPVEGREWCVDEAPDYVGGGHQLADRVPHTHGGREGALPVPTELLQSGSRKSDLEDRDRGGRSDTQAEKVEIFRRSEDCHFKLSRVESVKVLERRDIERLGLSCGYGEQVYNLEVEGNHNYFASGVLVSNCHFLKTPESQRTQAIFGNGTGLARRCRYIWGLSGTPVLNRPRELYPILKCLHNDGIAPYNQWDKFAQRFCGAFFDGRGINTKGASHIEELRGRLKGFMLRRTKAEVLPQLPPRIISHPPIELSNKELEPIFSLEAEIGDREAYLSPTHEDYAQLGDMARLLKVTGVAKIPKVAEFIKDILETETKVVVFARHRDVITGLEEALRSKGVVTYHGGMNDVQKAAAVNRFMGDSECAVFIGQITAAGTGINGLQTVCSNVVFAELDWVPGTMAQAIDRCHRIGQGAAAVNVYMPHVPGTLESAMLTVQLGKGKVIDALVGVRGVEEKNVLEGLV